MSAPASVSFDVYGLVITVESADGGVLEDLVRDFSYFSVDRGEAAMVIEILREAGPRDQLPRLEATLQTPRNTVFRSGDLAYIDYFGRALAISEEGGRRFRVYCTDRDLAHEVTYLTMLSRIGRHLDDRALCRVHALGLEAGGKAALVLLPMAGGKTTMALRLLREEGVRLVSEDSPLISSSGEVLPFPLRIGVRLGGEPPGVPERFTRTVERMDFGPKTLIDIRCFSDRLANPCPPGAILLGERWLAGPSSIEPASRGAAIKPFLKNCVVGLGLYQGMEFVLERSGWEILGKLGLALSRLRSSLAVIRRSRVYRFTMGPNIEQSASVLASFLHTMKTP